MQVKGVNSLSSLLKIFLQISLIIGILVLIALGFTIFLYQSYYTIGCKICIGFISVLFFAIGIALYILKSLFKDAITYKEENELTI